MVYQPKESGAAQSKTLSDGSGGAGAGRGKAADRQPPAQPSWEKLEQKWSHIQPGRPFALITLRPRN